MKMHCLKFLKDHLTKIKLKRSFYTQNAIILAQDLLGKWIIRKSLNKIQCLKILETEAYLGSFDLASHARFDKNKRSSVLYEIGGTIYVYMIYGIHFMLNIVSSYTNKPEAVLIRKGKLINLDLKNKNAKISYLNINGPGILCKALNIDKNFNKIDATQSKNFYIIPYFLNTIENDLSYTSSNIYVSKRIGISYAKNWANKLLRFYIN